MPDIQITDQLDRPVATVEADLANPSSLVNYLKAQALHVAVVPDFLERKDLLLSAAATKPIRFDAKGMHAFQLGDAAPAISFTPGGKVSVMANASPGSDLFRDDPFRVAAQVPAQTGYVGVVFEGSVEAQVSGSEGDLTFGFDQSGVMDLAYYRAFPLGVNEPKLLDALTVTMDRFVVPGKVGDLALLSVGDVATVSGSGTLKVKGGVSVTVSPNPLASVDLPLSAGTLSVKAGATAGLSASLEISGAYEIRARRTSETTIELSYLRRKGETSALSLSAKAGVTAVAADTDLLPLLLGAISKDPLKDHAMLGDLKPEEQAELMEAVRQGLNHSVQASLNAVLSSMEENEAAFQYEIQPGQLSTAASEALRRALRGDLGDLTSLEGDAAADGTVAPGIRVLNSVLRATNKRGATLHVNLLGILNFTSLAEFIRHSEVLTDHTTGNLTIRETVTGNRISDIVAPLDRDEALRKALFDGLLVTTTYRAAKAVAMPSLQCQHVHFTFQQNTSRQTVADYLSWFAALHLVRETERAALMEQMDGPGPSSCILRSAFDDSDCANLFFDESGRPRAAKYYLGIGRAAMLSLLGDESEPINQLRLRLLGDAIWPKALEIGANVNVGPLVGLSTSDLRVNVLIGDLVVITDWAEGMSAVGPLVREMQDFVAKQDPAGLAQSSDFQQKAQALQKKIATMVHASTMRFEEPFGMIAMYWAAGSPLTAYAKAVTAAMSLERRSQPAVKAA